MDMASRQVILTKRENNHYIIQLAIDGNINAKAVQQYQLWIQAKTLADITHTDGQQLEAWEYLQISEGRRSNLKWPRKSKPTRSMWNK